MTDRNPQTSASVPLIIGFAAVLLLIGTAGAWSVRTEIAGAVVATGVVEVESERQVVQHPDGGVVGAILARDGDRVEAGDTVLRLDDTFLRSELAVVERQLAEIFARRARFAAERDEAEAPDFGDPPEFSLVSAEEIAEQINGQRALFAARRTSLSQEQEQLAEQQVQIDRQIEGIGAQLAALERQKVLVGEELANVNQLRERGLVQASRVLELEREDARLQGEIGRMIATLGEAEARISGLSIESLRLIERRREDAITQLRDIQYMEIELQERQISLMERMARLDVRSPVSGVIFGSRVVAEQSVVRPADPIMYVVPGDQPLLVSARINPVDIDQVQPGQDVALMFTSFSQRTTPEVAGTVARVSADAVTDQTTGEVFYEAIVVPDPDEIAALDGLTLLPGMPVETFVKTAERTPLSYLTRPLTVYFDRALREE